MGINHNSSEKERHQISETAKFGWGMFYIAEDMTLQSLYGFCIHFYCMVKLRDHFGQLWYPIFASQYKRVQIFYNRILLTVLKSNFAVSLIL